MTTELEHKAARERRYDLRTPIIRAIYDVCQAIEECGASEKLTHAVTLAGALMEPVRVLLEERDALAAPVPARECWRHVKTGGTYEVIAREAHMESGSGRLLTVYQGKDGAVWIRPHAEFHDGRFERIPPPPAADK